MSASPVTTLKGTAVKQLRNAVTFAVLALLSSAAFAQVQGDVIGDPSRRLPGVVEIPADAPRDRWVAYVELVNLDNPLVLEAVLSTDGRFDLTLPDPVPSEHLGTYFDCGEVSVPYTFVNTLRVAGEEYYLGNFGYADPADPLRLGIFYYSAADYRLYRSCEVDEGLEAVFELDLKRGWNQVVLEFVPNAEGDDLVQVVHRTTPHGDGFRWTF